jgi:AcrR family transcriptional regulator
MTAEPRTAGGRSRPPSAPPARPAEDRPPAERLLTAAEELFGERSYHRTTVADICARAGMATGSFYSYYGSKAEIFAAVVRAINTDLRRAMKAAIEHAGGGQRASERASFRVYFDMLSQRPWMDRIVRESEFIDPGLFREYYEHLTRGYARGVRAAQLAREVDANYDPEVIAFAYTGIGNFVGMRWADWTAGGQVPEDVLDDVLELLARGLVPKTTGAEQDPLSPAVRTALWTAWGRCRIFLGKPPADPVDKILGSAAGGSCAASAGTQSSGRGPRATSSATCIAHHGEMGCSPLRTAAQN